MSDWKITGLKLDSSGMKELLNEDFVRADLTDRAGRVQAAAQAGNPKYTYVVEQKTTDRAAVSVGSSDDGVLFSETNTGNLLRALDSGGGSS